MPERTAPSTQSSPSLAASPVALRRRRARRGVAAGPSGRGPCRRSVVTTDLRAAATGPARPAAGSAACAAAGRGPASPSRRHCHYVAPPAAKGPEATPFRLEHRCRCPLRDLGLASCLPRCTLERCRRRACDNVKRPSAMSCAFPAHCGMRPDVCFHPYATSKCFAVCSAATHLSEGGSGSAFTDASGVSLATESAFGSARAESGGVGGAAGDSGMPDSEADAYAGDSGRGVAGAPAPSPYSLTDLKDSERSTSDLPEPS